MKSTNEIRDLLGIMRGKKPHNKGFNESASKKNLTTRDLLGRMRKLNENTDKYSNLATEKDQKDAEKKMRNYFHDNNVNIVFEPLEIYNTGVYWSGSMDGQLFWEYKVAPDENNSGADVKYDEENFDSKDPEIVEIIKKIDSYYDEFYRYWRDNAMEK